jgi:hypothetical protein
MNKHIILSCLASVLALGANAQNGINTPYSQYGLGTLSDASQGFSRGMNGAAVGVRRGNVVNSLNPASYSAIDSLTMIFDVGLSGQVSHMTEGSTSVNAQNANFDYVVGGFRLLPHVGMAFGVLPFSDIGYKYTASNFLNRTDGTLTETYSGEGGIHKAFLGLGWEPVKGFSVGVNAGYLWGTYDRSITTSSTTYIHTLKKNYSATVNNYSLDAGVQWQKKLSRKDALTLGVTVGIGHKLGADPGCEIIKNSTDTTSFRISNGLSIPMTYAVGVAWSHGENLVVDADFSLEKWGGLDFPGHTSDDSYTMVSGLLKDRKQVRLGADYVPLEMSSNFFKRTHYKFGVGYATPYYNINGADGPKELSLSAGFGIPLNSRSVLNVSAQWTRTAASGMITDNTFRINLGLTFNERWFSKWKID